MEGSADNDLPPGKVHLVRFRASHRICYTPALLVVGLVLFGGRKTTNENPLPAVGKRTIVVYYRNHEN
jgi:hypothetical protein